MRINRLSDLWRWDGTIDRGPYLLVGVMGFALKHNLDRVLASAFGRQWRVFNYIVPVQQVFNIRALSRADIKFLAAMIGLAIPFIWVGVVLTVKRLRAAQLPQGLVILFFAPFVNLIFFLLLSILPSRQGQNVPGPLRWRLAEIIPEDSVGSALLAILVTAVLSLACVALGVYGLKRYGWGLFVGIPFTMGMVSALLHGYHRPRSLGACIAVANLSAALLGLGLLALAMEGIFCLVMAMPLACVLASLGGLVGFFMQRRPGAGSEAFSAIMITVTGLAVLMGAEAIAGPKPPDFAVRSSIIVNAPPETVWHNVISFSELPTPTEWMFRLGIAYPTRATIAGRGPGAMRRCVFSTGAFEEPIHTWEAPRRLGFSVRSMPPPMQEWTPYKEIHPPHLQGYLNVERGEFLLTALPDGRTRLEGTTWYQHNMWPAAYWQTWSDYLIEHIHLRVLKHIKNLSEAKA